MAAVMSRNITVCTTLIAGGADLNCKSKDGLNAVQHMLTARLFAPVLLALVEAKKPNEANVLLVAFDPSWQPPGASMVYGATLRSARTEVSGAGRVGMLGKGTNQHSI